eukprot:2836675-Prymnesium_polylepis.2
MAFGCQGTGAAQGVNTAHSTTPQGKQGWVGRRSGGSTTRMRSRSGRDTVVPWIMENTGGISPV